MSGETFNINELYTVALILQDLVTPSKMLTQDLSFENRIKLFDQVSKLCRFFEAYKKSSYETVDVLPKDLFKDVTK